jgi:hypothetical protein
MVLISSSQLAHGHIDAARPLQLCDGDDESNDIRRASDFPGKGERRPKAIEP